MLKPCASQCVTNPIPASQVVNVDVDWKSLVEPDCPDLNPSIQSLVDSIDAINAASYDLGCLTVSENNTTAVVQALIEEVCSEDPVVPTNTIIEPLDLSNCSTDNFNCDTPSEEVCLNFSDCQGSETFESQIQALVDRVISLSYLNLALCDRVSTLENQVIALQNATDCCDTSSIENSILVLNSSIIGIQTQLNTCCNGQL